MATVLLPIGTIDAVSSPFTLANGEVANLFLVGVGGETPAFGSYAQIQIQGSDSQWATCFVLAIPSAPNARAAAFSANALKMMAGIPNSATARIEGPGSFRVKRTADTSTVGVERA